MIFTLEALQADQGDCLLLHYGQPGGARVILIDGGPGGIYNRSLKPRLEELRGRQSQIALEMVIVSHIDDDHIHGIVDLVKQLKTVQEKGQTPLPYRIRTLWHNSFDKLIGRSNPAALNEVSGASAAALDAVVPAGIERESKGGAVIASVNQGNDLRNYARALTIPLNRGVKEPLVMAPKTGRREVDLGAGLKFTILGPHEAEMNKLQEEWRKAKVSGKAESQAFAADYLNRTAENLSSIVVLAEFQADGKPLKRMLLTGDSGGDLVLKGLETAGLLEDGKIHVDLLKLQHHGSSHSVDQSFFERVTADCYLISGNGKHGNPHPDTLQWLSAARSREEYRAYLTNREGHEGLTANLDAFLESEKENEPGHRYFFRPEGARSIGVDLLEAA
ncbi:MAG: MBL fold metallo-hydrolase [Bryobacterales bacterium]|nr:MBL fold metallo-hydrolase [Bryobacterales bacterium]